MKNYVIENDIEDDVISLLSFVIMLLMDLREIRIRVKKSLDKK